MAEPLPAPVHRYLEGKVMAARQPAYVAVDERGLIAHRGGRLEHYGQEAVEGTSAEDALPFLVGLLPMGEARPPLPLVHFGGTCYANVHFTVANKTVWVILLDASNEGERLASLQQTAHDLALLRQREKGLIERLESSQRDLTAILDRLRLITIILTGQSRIEYISAAARVLSDTDPTALVGRPWELAFAFRDSDHEAIRDAIARADGTTRLRLEVERGSRRPGIVELEVHPVPHDKNKRILHLYDISELCSLREQLRDDSRFHQIVGKSAPMRRVFRMIEDVAAVDATVLIAGETGTGKELVAAAIHNASPRKDGPFIVVNCAGLADSLINSQLFGHRKGAFTDAVRDQEGVFEAAHGGTILLDEIGDVPLNTQRRLLRVLEQREVIRIGETKARKVDIRILAATHRDLMHEVEAGRFRQDLLYRIRIARIVIPPLCDRREDIPLLATTFLKAVCAGSGREVQGIAPDAVRALLEYSWPGNVRELRNAMEFAIISCRGDLVTKGDLPPEILEPARTFATAHATPDSERQRIAAALAETDGKRDEAAALLGLSRTTLYRRMKALMPDRLR